MPGARDEDLEIDDTILSELIHDAPDAVIVVDRRMAIRYANPATRVVLGYDPDELLGRDYSLLVPEQLRAAHAGHHAGYVADPSARPMGTGLALTARRRDGTSVPVAIALVPLRTGDLIAAFVRDITVRHRLADRVAATNEVVTAGLAGVDRSELLGQITRRARTLVGASRSWFGELDGTGFVVRATDGHGGPLRTGETLEAPEGLLPSGGPTVHVVADPDVVHDLGLPGLDASAIASLLVAEVRVGDEEVGALVLGRAPDDAPFDSLDREIAGQFATTVALVLGLLRARDERVELMTMADHDRIARDLHDTVIQQIFAVALRLESAIQASSGPAGERMREAVDQLDEVIRDLRTSIFGLQRPDSAAGGVRDRVQRVVAEYREALGFAPRLGFRGPVDTMVPETHATELVAAVRESLSNVARHAHASAVEVVVSAGDDLELFVTDNGIGPSTEVSAGHGLENLRARAEELGGTCTVRAASTGGTVVDWFVPLSNDTGTAMHV